MEKSFTIQSLVQKREHKLKSSNFRGGSHYHTGKKGRIIKKKILDAEELIEIDLDD